jgi:hypothetical protein
VSLVPRSSDIHRTATNKWDIIHYALGKPSRTILFCVILTVSSASPAVPFLILALAHRWLG